MTRWIALSCWLAWAWAAESGLAAQSLVPSETDFAGYALVVQRNIFDPSRRPPQADRGPTPTPAPAPETLDLTGVVVQTSGGVALFEGTKIAGSKAVREGQDVQGLRLNRVRTDSVLASDGPTSLTLRVGARIAKPFGGAWTIAARPAAAAAPTATPAASPSGEAGSSRDRSNSSRGRGSSSRDRTSSSTDRATPTPSATPSSGQSSPSSASDSSASSLAEQMRERRRREMGQ